MNKRLSIVLQILLGLLAFAGGLYVAITPANSVVRWYNIDDAFYYYKVAQNVWAGYGFTFDKINLTNGFHPLWMVVCLGVFWLTKYNLLLPLRVLILVSSLCNAISCVLLFRFLVKRLHPCAAVIGVLIWGLYYPIYNTVVSHGMESSLVAVFVVLLLSKAADYLDSADSEHPNPKKLFWLGVIGGFTILSRLDTLFVVGIIGVFLLFKLKKVPSLLIFDLIAFAVSVFAAWIIRLGFEGVTLNAFSVYPMLAVSALLKPVVFYFSGLYTRNGTVGKFKNLLRIALGTLIAFVIEYVLLFVFYKMEITTMFSNSVVVFDAALSFVLILLIRILLPHSILLIQENPFAQFKRVFLEKWKMVLLGGICYGAPIAVMIGTYMIINKIGFGTFTPVSGQIKHWWSTMPNTIYAHTNTLLSVLGLDTSSGSGPWSLFTYKIAQFTHAFVSFARIPGENAETTVFVIFVILSIILFFLVMSLENGKLARKFFAMMLPAILLGCLIHITYYTATGYSHTRAWYWIAEMLTLVVIGSLLLDGLFTWIDGILPKLMRYSIPTILVLLVAYSIIQNFYWYIKGLSPYYVPEENQADYLIETRTVQSLTDEGSLIGMTGGGSVAYFIEYRTVVNLDGLINSAEYFNAMKTGKATEFLDALPLKYVYGKPYTLLESDPYDEIFKDRLEEIGFIRGFENFTLFRYRVGE